MKKIIIALIKDDICHTRLIDDLNRLGFDANNHYLNLSQTIFNLMGINHRDVFKSDKLNEEYLKLIRERIHDDIDSIAELIYQYLKSV